MRDRLQLAGWQVEVADARKVKVSRRLRERPTRSTRVLAELRRGGVLSQWGLKLSRAWLRQPDALELLEARGVPA